MTVIDRPHTVEAVKTRLISAANALWDWGSMSIYSKDTAAELLHASEQCRRAAWLLDRSPHTLDEAIAILDAVQSLLTLTDE